jgi:hypothetical protein
MRISPVPRKCWFSASVVLLFILVLSSCSTVQSDLPISVTPSITSTIHVTETKRVRKTRTATMVVTRQPTWTPHPSKEPTPTSEPTPSPTLPSVVWADILAPPVVIENFHGSWSPVRNEIAGIISENFLSAGTLTIARSPAYAPVTLDPMHSDKIWRNLTWTPDGIHVLYMVEQDPSHEGWGSNDLWIINTETGEALDTDKTLSRIPNFKGWMDDEVVVYSEYAGGGALRLTQWNYQTGEILSSEVLSGYTVPLTIKYVPVMDCVLGCTPFVILRDPNKNEDCFYGCNVAAFPKQKIPLNQWIEAFFQDWYGEERMLVSVMGVENKIEHARLFLWNIWSDQLTPVANGGVFGSFSPDDKYLAWITHGPLVSEIVEPLSSFNLDPFDGTEQAYLHWRDIASNQTIASVPVSSLTPHDAEVDGTLFPFFTFSPDSRWITIVSPGRFRSSNQNVTINDKEDDGLSFNIFELDTGQLLHSMDYQGSEYLDRFRMVTWSPKSDRFVFLDADGNWMLYLVHSRTIIPITAEYVEKIESVTWSSDGRYLQFVIRKAISAYHTCETYTTYIFEIPD